MTNFRPSRLLATLFAVHFIACLAAAATTSSSSSSSSYSSSSSSDPYSVAVSSRYRDSRRRSYNNHHNHHNHSSTGTQRILEQLGYINSSASRFRIHGSRSRSGHSHSSGHQGHAPNLIPTGSYHSIDKHHRHYDHQNILPTHNTPLTSTSRQSSARGGSRSAGGSGGASGKRRMHPGPKGRRGKGTSGKAKKKSVLSSGAGAGKG